MNNTTLENIRRYSSKLQKLIEYNTKLQNTELVDYNNVFPILLNSNSTDLEIVESFYKDIEKTVKYLVDSQKVINSINSDGVIVEFESENNTIEDVFGETYNKDTNIITLNGIEFNVDYVNNFKAADFRDMIIQKTLGINNQDYKTIISTLKTEDKLESGQQSDMIKLITNSIIKIDEVKSKIKSMVSNYQDIRNSFSLDEKNIIDREITFNRGMIDSVIQSSTYIDDEGIKQLSSEHSKSIEDKKYLDEVSELIKNSRYISDIEIDQDADFKKVINLIKQIENLNLNTVSKFTFKARKLGNYGNGGVEGMYLPMFNMVTVDYRKASSAIHEIVHFLDYNSYKTFEREELVNHFKNKLPVEMRNDDYLGSDDEIIARLGELAFRIELDKNNIVLEDNDIRLVESQEGYMKSQYFGYPNFTEQEEKMLSDFFNTMFRVDNTMELVDNYNFRKIDTDYSSVIKGVKNKNVEIDLDKEFLKILKSINKDNIQTLLEYNKVNCIFEEKDLTIFLMNNIGSLGNHKKSMGMDEWMDMTIDRVSMLRSLIDNYRENADDLKDFKELFSFSNSWNYYWRNNLSSVTAFDMKLYGKINDLEDNVVIRDLNSCVELENFKNTYIKIYGEDRLTEVKIDFKDLLIKGEISTYDLPKEIKKDIELNIELMKEHNIVVDNDICFEYIKNEGLGKLSDKVLKELTFTQQKELLNESKNYVVIDRLLNVMVNEFIDKKVLYLKDKDRVQSLILPLIEKYPSVLDKLKDFEKNDRWGIGSLSVGKKHLNVIDYIESEIIRKKEEKKNIENDLNGDIDYKKMKTPEISKILKDKDISVEVLEKLSKHSSLKVKEQVMYHPNISIEILENYSKSKNKDLTYSLAGVENLPKNILLELSVKDDEYTRKRVLDQSNLDKEVFNSFFNFTLNKGKEEVKKEGYSSELSGLVMTLITNDNLNSKIDNSILSKSMGEVINKLVESRQIRSIVDTIQWKHNEINKEMFHSILTNFNDYQIQELYESHFGEFKKDEFTEDKKPTKQIQLSLFEQINGLKNDVEDYDKEVGKFSKSYGSYSETDINHNSKRI